MKIKIHRGSKEIGGTCVKLSSGDTTILIDVGLPLVDDGKTLTIPDGKIDGVLISHPHQDHFGLIDLLPVDVPVYTGPISKELFQATRLFLDKSLFENNFHTFTSWKKFQVGSFTITPHLMDHSAPDAYAFEIESNGKRLFYSGDFRAHGRKAILFDNLIKRPPKDIDVLILEGTMIKRSNEKYPNERAVEDSMVEVLNDDPGLVFLICSSQNIDRIVSAYRAAKRTNRIFVVDIYTAWILEKISFVSEKSPKIEWPLIRVLSRGETAGNHYRTIKSNREYFGGFAQSLYKSGNVITEDEILQNPSKFFIKNPRVQHIKNQLVARSTTVIYSMWIGYLDDRNTSYSYLPAIKIDPEIELIPIHTSGHAVVGDLKKMAQAIKPGIIIPVHTEYGKKYDKYFPNVCHLDDGETITLEKKTVSNITRYFSNEKFMKVKTDLSFLFRAVNVSQGELDFQIRPNNKLNLYYKGNSLAQIAIRKDDYQIRVHREFHLKKALGKDLKKRFPSSMVKSSGDYDWISVDANLVHPCLQQKVITSLAGRIKKVNNGEEIAFEQSLITDNLGRSDFIIIDRQVAGGGLPGMLDLLAIKKNKKNVWSFVVLEVKLGNNKELTGSVYSQLDGYVKAIKANIAAFKKCYENNYEQKKELGLFPEQLPETIKIDNDVEGMIVVGSYSNIGNIAIAELKRRYPKMRYKVCQFSNVIKV